MHKVKVSQVNHSVTSILYSVILGIYFQLKGVNYTNNSEVIITDIGSSDDESLLCITDKTDCCENPNRMGEWYFPDMSMVRVNGSGDSFFRNRGPSVVRLHRRHDVTMPTGDFYCEVPDANGVDQRIYIRVEGNNDILLRIKYHLLCQQKKEQS